MRKFLRVLAILLLPYTSLLAQQRTVSGVILDEKKRPDGRCYCDEQ